MRTGTFLMALVWGFVPLAQAQAPVATIVRAGIPVERSGDGKAWQTLPASGKLLVGDHVRSQGVALIEFPWTSVEVGPATTLTIPTATILAVRLDAGRVEVQSELDEESIHVTTAELSLRGSGNAVVRRSGERTMVTVLDGEFRAEATGRTETARRGQALVAEQGSLILADLPAAPTGLTPGAEVVYVNPGQAVPVSWVGVEGSRYHYEILPLDTDRILVAGDSDLPAATLALPGIGTYRWRVAAVSERGLEGPPSTEGLICVVDK